MTTSWKNIEGCPWPLGATWLPAEDAYNFALFARHARAVRLFLFRSPADTVAAFVVEFNPLVNKSDDIWHCRVPSGQAAQCTCYSYQVDSLDGWLSGEGVLFAPGKELLDPYARSIALPDAFDRSAATGEGANTGKALLAGLPPRQVDPFDWGSDRRPDHEGDLIIYEMHVRGFTRNENSHVSSSEAGRYLGVIQKIPYLRELGVTALELMPVFQFEPDCDNYWGYMPIGFFSPHCYYASAAASAVTEFRTMVKALHAADIEVILDVVFNHTAEAGADGPCYSMKGIDNTTYYLTDGIPPHSYLDYSGTGNTLNSSNRAVRKMVLDSLRFWVKEMHVDGFRFDLASVFARNSDGSLNMGMPAIIAEMGADPELSGVRLIAEPWDAGGAYQLGQNFAGQSWSQWNGKFRDDIRRFVRSEPGLVEAVMRRIYGSDDLFPDDLHNAKHPYQSINYCTSHDGFTLYDSVAYEQKHNEANGANNLDGPSENISWNCGYEGDTGAPPAVLKLRRQQVKNFCALLMLSNGVPMFRMGDEFLQTQQGNSNPWNQDNETSWLDWERLDANQDIFRFFQRMIAFRKQHSICRSRFWRGDVRWYGVAGETDRSWESRSLAFSLHNQGNTGCDVYVMINMYWEELQFVIQERGLWKRVVDTSCNAPEDILEPSKAFAAGPAYKVKARSIVVLTRDIEDRPHA
jgi:isoamylase